MEKRRRILWVLPLVVVIIGLIIAVMNARQVPEVGLQDGRLRPCPSSPNCVCSQAEDVEHQIDPLRFTGSTDQAIEQLEAVIRGLPRTRIVTSHGSYLHAEFTSLIFRFVDDVEFVVDESEQRIDVRSCSRVGYSDQGVNRKRVEKIRQLFAQ